MVSAERDGKFDVESRVGFKEFAAAGPDHQPEHCIVDVC